MHVINEAKIDQIFPFIRFSQTVNDQYIINAFLIELPDKSAADKSGATCDDNHLFNSFIPFLNQALSLLASSSASSTYETRRLLLAAAISSLI
jgi:hypothetical protein